MNYANHNLRTSLQEWRNRIYRADHNQFEHQIKFLLDNLGNNRQLSGLLSEAMASHPFTDEQCEEIIEAMRGGSQMSFENEEDQAAFCYKFLKFFTDKNKRYNLHNWGVFMSRDFEAGNSSQTDPT